MNRAGVYLQEISIIIALNRNVCQKSFKKGWNTARHGYGYGYGWVQQEKELLWISI